MAGFVGVPKLDPGFPATVPEPYLARRILRLFAFPVTGAGTGPVSAPCGRRYRNGQRLLLRLRYRHPPSLLPGKREQCRLMHGRSSRYR